MIKLKFRNVDFYGGRKTGEPREKPSKQVRESTTNSTHMKYPSRGLNPRTTGTTAVRGERITATPPMLPHALMQRHDYVIVQGTVNWSISEVRFCLNIPCLLWTACVIYVPGHHTRQMTIAQEICEALLPLLSVLSEHHVLCEEHHMSETSNKRKYNVIVNFRYQ
jgi:hypothetical protein